MSESTNSNPSAAETRKEQSIQTTVPKSTLDDTWHKVVHSQFSQKPVNFESNPIESTTNPKISHLSGIQTNASEIYNDIVFESKCRSNVPLRKEDRKKIVKECGKKQRLTAGYIVKCFVFYGVLYAIYAALFFSMMFIFMRNSTDKPYLSGQGSFLGLPGMSLIPGYAGLKRGLPTITFTADDPSSYKGYVDEIEEFLKNNQINVNGKISKDEIRKQEISDVKESELKKGETSDVEKVENVVKRKKRDDGIKEVVPTITSTISTPHLDSVGSSKSNTPTVDAVPEKVVEEETPSKPEEDIKTTTSPSPLVADITTPYLSSTSSEQETIAASSTTVPIVRTNSTVSALLSTTINPNSAVINSSYNQIEKCLSTECLNACPNGDTSCKGKMTSCFSGGNECMQEVVSKLIEDSTKSVDCSSENNYGYAEGEPCLILSINNVINWTPSIFVNFSNLPELYHRRNKIKQLLKNELTPTQTFSEELINHAILSQPIGKTIPVSCSYVSANDTDDMSNSSQFKLSPALGISNDFDYYPFKYSKNGTQIPKPYVVVKLTGFPINELVEVACRYYIDKNEMDEKDKVVNEQRFFVKVIKDSKREEV